MKITAETVRYFDLNAQSKGEKWAVDNFISDVGTDIVDKFRYSINEFKKQMKSKDTKTALAQLQMKIAQKLQEETSQR